MNIFKVMMVYAIVGVKRVVLFFYQVPGSLIGLPLGCSGAANSGNRALS